METNIQERPDTSTPAPATLPGSLGWLKRHERAVLITAVVFQLGVLVAMLVMRLSIVLYGQTIMLRVVPVDPRDLFRGDYVILSYEFSRPRGTITGLQSIWPGEQRGRTIYVSLAPESDGKHWSMTELSVNPPPDGTIYLRGKLNDWGQVECGIESFFVQEGKGKAYEDAVRERRLSAEVAVTPDGRAALKRLHIENKE
jgi:uncharacterized membrane-anchored protein